MIKERPASMTKVVVAFAGTVLVAVLPLALIAVTRPDVDADVVGATAGYGGPVLLVGVPVVLVAVAAVVLGSVLRRKPRAVRA